MITFKKDINAQDQPITWRYYKYNDKILMVENDKKRLVKLLVIVDSNEHYLGIINHVILKDGSVSPSVVCPVKGCNFHENIKLEEYEE